LVFIFGFSCVSAGILLNFSLHGIPDKVGSFPEVVFDSPGCCFRVAGFDCAQKTKVVVGLSGKCVNREMCFLDFFVVMFGQLSSQRGLRGIETGLALNKSNFYHVGVNL